MKLSYDPEVDALRIVFGETTVTTKHLAEGIAANYDAAGRLAGLEVLDAFTSGMASKLRPMLVLWEDMADGVVAAVTKAVPRFITAYPLPA
jgi:uncharacterized protein YuzE